MVGLVDGGTAVVVAPMLALVSIDVFEFAFTGAMLDVPLVLAPE